MEKWEYALVCFSQNAHRKLCRFFKEHTGFPKFKCKNDHNYSYAINFTNHIIEPDFENNKVKLSKLKWVKCKLHRELA